MNREKLVEIRKRCTGARNGACQTCDWIAGDYICETCISEDMDYVLALLDEADARNAELQASRERVRLALVTLMHLDVGDNLEDAIDTLEYFGRNDFDPECQAVARVFRALLPDDLKKEEIKNDKAN